MGVAESDEVVLLVRDSMGALVATALADNVYSFMSDGLGGVYTVSITPAFGAEGDIAYSLVAAAP